MLGWCRAPGAALFALCVCSAGCSGSDGGALPDSGVDGGEPTSCPRGGEGQISLTVEAPEGIALSPLVHVVGGGLSEPATLAADTPLNVPAGPGYELEVRREKLHPETGGGLVGVAFYPEPEPFDGCVREGQTAAVTVVYAQEPGSERLWLTLTNDSSRNDLAAYAPDRLTAGANAPTTFMKAHTNQEGQAVIDSAGNLWIADSGIPEKVVMIRMERLARTDNQPDVILDGPALNRPRGLAFDGAGNLWVANGVRAMVNQIVQIAAADLRATGAPSAAVTITSPDLQDAEAIALDASDNLWVACKGNDSVLRFDAARLAADYDGPADRVLTAARLNMDGSVARDYGSPQSLAFDRDGNLWVGFWSGNEIVRFTPADLDGEGAARIDDPLEKTSGVASLVTALAFDEEGGLWYPSSAGRFARLAPDALTAPGMTMPDIVVEGGMFTATKLFFNPVPAGLPIRD
jgi:streptogramin lyase